MFDELRDAFRKAVSNFKEEISRDDVPETVDRLLKGMKDEAADTRAHVKRLEQEIELAVKIAEREEAAAETCRRRESLARKIGDEETARVASEYCKKHESKRDVMRHKADALREELKLTEAAFSEMVQKIKEAQRDRDQLAATASRSSARDTIRGAGDLFDELDRMAEVIGEEGSDAAAGEEVWREMERTDDAAPVDFDARLEELKRRMGKD